jgi:hypothetical protein
MPLFCGVNVWGDLADSSLTDASILSGVVCASENISIFAAVKIRASHLDLPLFREASLDSQSSAGFLSPSNPNQA